MHLDGAKHAISCYSCSNSAMNAAGNIRPLMDEIRVHADILETEISDKMWPLPKYREMLFIK